MSDLDLGTLVARLKLEGADQYNRDVTKSKNAFIDLADAAKRADRDAGSLRSPRALTDIRTDADKATTAVSGIGDGAGRTSSKLAGAGDGMSKARRDIESDARAASKAVEQIGDSAEGVGKKTTNAFRDSLSGLGGAARDSGGEMAGGFLEGFGGGKIAELGTKGGPVGLAIAGAAALGVGAGALLAKNVMAGFDIQSQRGFAQTKFGLSNEMLEQAGLAAGNAYGQTFGESVQANIDTAGTALQSGLLKGNETADQIQPVIEGLTTVSQLMGTEIPETARAAGQMVKTGLAKNAEDAMDQLTVASQKGLNISDDLLDTVTEYGTQYRKLGIDGATALGTIQQMMQGGARDTDIAADALKEFSLRVIDGSDSTKDAFTSLKLNAEKTSAEFGKGGEAASRMADTVIDKLRAIQDPVERNRIGVELFGTQWEDLGGAISKMDLSKASKDLGEIGGAAKRAGDNLTSGPGAAMDKLKKQVEVQVQDIQLALANAFGPAVEKLANGLVEHKDDIVSFVTQLISNFLTLGISVGNVASGLLHVWGWTTGELGKMIGSMVTSIGTGMKQLGNMLDVIGLDSLGGAMQRAGDLAEQAGHGLSTMGDKAHGAANFVSDQLVPAMAQGRDKMDQMGDEARSGAGKLDELRKSIVAVPDSKSIVIKDNSPETKEKLEKLGMQVTTLPNGDVKVTATTKAAEDTLREFMAKPRTIDVVTKLITDPSGATQNSYPSGNSPGGAVHLPGRAGGGQVFGPGGPRDDAFLVPLSNREWVHPVSAVDYYGTDFMSAVNERRFPRILTQGLADGGQVGYGLASGTSIDNGASGFPDWISALGSRYGVTPSTYAGHQETDRGEAGYAPNPQHLNRGIDWSGSVDQMQAFAEAMMSAAVSDPSIEQVIWQNPNTGQKLGWHGRQPDTDGSYYASDYPAHQSHVHTRFSAQIGSQQQGMGTIQDVTLSATSSREDVARKIIAEGRKRGYSDAEIEAFLATALQESNLSNSAIGGGGAWHGIFQQDQSYTGRDDPNSNVTGFYDRMDKLKGSQGYDSKDPYANAFWLQQAPGAGSAQAAIAGGRQGYLTEIKSKQGEAASLMSKLGPTVGTGSGGAGEFGGSGMPVQVTNWPSGFGSGSSSSSSSGSSDYSPSGGSSSDVPDVDNKEQVTDSDLLKGRSAVTAAERAVVEAQAAQKVAQTKYDTAKWQDKAAARGDLDKANDTVTEAQATAQTSRELLGDLQARHDNFATAPDRSDLITKQAELAKARRDLVRLQREAGVADKAAQDARTQRKSATDIAQADADATKAHNAVTSAQDAITQLESDVAQAQKDAGKSVGERRKSGAGGKGPLPLVAYANGGWGGPTAATMLDDARAWVTLAGEAGRELYLPIDGSAKSKNMWMQAGQELGMLKAYAQGGFGGYADDNTDWMRPTSAADWFGLATGGAFAAASLVGPYAALAYQFATTGAGSISLGDIAPQMSTGTNDIPGLSQVISDQTSALANQIAELQKAVAENKRVAIQVQDIRGLLEKSGIHLAAMS